MAFRLTSNDLDLMTGLAEYRVLTKGQITRLFRRNERALRGRLTELSAADYLKTESTMSAKRGRPEIQAALTEAGIDLLKERRLIPESVPAAAILPGQLACSAHHKALNDFRVGLAALQGALPALKVHFLTAMSPTLRDMPAGRVFAADWLGGRQAVGDPTHLIPDGAFMIKHEVRDKALLFFLEIDMGTEALASVTRPQGDVRHKVEDYQAYFRSGRYKRYGEAWQCQFNGFRVLFVTSPAGRCVSLCRLARANPPSAFIWVTDQDRVMHQGLAAPVWSRGGKTAEPETSILGPEVSRQVLQQAGRSEPAVDGRRGRKPSPGAPP